MAREQLKDIFRHELKSADSMEELFAENETEEISEDCLELTKELLENAEEVVKMKVILETTASIGRALDDEELIQFAMENMKVITDAGA